MTFFKGGLLSGIMYDRLNPELLLGISTCLMGLFTICAPWGHFAMFVALTFFQFACNSFIDSGTYDAYAF